MPALATKFNPMQPTNQGPALVASLCDAECVHLSSDSLHDLGSPINHICSLVDLIVSKYGGQLDEDAKLLFGHLRNSGGRLENLMAGLYTYIRVTSCPTSYQRCEGHQLLASALTMIDHAIARHEVLVTSGPLPELYCDPSQVTYALASLIENAIKFRSERRPEIHVGAVPDDDAWVISVRDNGMGIDTRYAERIFATFKRIHNDAYPGAGVGLAITKRVMEGHGGRVWVDSEPGQGSVFYLKFPKKERSIAGRSGEQIAGPFAP